MIGQYRLDATANNLAQYPEFPGLRQYRRQCHRFQRRYHLRSNHRRRSNHRNRCYGNGNHGSSPTLPPAVPVLSIMDAENLLVSESFSIPENITGRSVLSAAADMLYTVSDSGVMVFPVGRLNQQHRLSASVRDVVARGTFCNQQRDYANHHDHRSRRRQHRFPAFQQHPGVTISPSSGITPAVVQVRVDPTAFQNQNGTLSVAINMNSVAAVNMPPPIRLLINNRNPDQRGTFVNVPGYLTDLLADPVRNRFYIVAQDTDQVLVFDSTSYSQIAALKTSATPTQIAFTFDRKYLIIGHDNAQQAWVYDLDSLQRQAPIQFPSGHYPRSIAESGKSMLALVRNVAGGGPGKIDRIDFAARKAIELPSLGVYSNSVNPDGVIAPAPNGGAILVADARRQRHALRRQRRYLYRVAQGFHRPLRRLRRIQL